MDGQLLSGIGSLCMGASALVGAIWTISRASRFLEHLKNNGSLIAERDHFKELAARNAERADAAERSAQNLERAANGAENYAGSLERRVAAIEERLTLFDKLVVYTRRLLEWATKAEAASRRDNVKLPPIPSVPKELVAALAEVA